MPISESITKIRMKIDQRRCSPMTLDSANIRFMRIFPWRGGVKQQWGNRKSGFSGFRTLSLRHHRKWGQHYYIVTPLPPFHWPQNTWPWMTLNGVNGHFTLNVHYYELPLSNYLFLIYCRVCLHFGLHTWPAEKCRKRSSGPWSAEYSESVENCVSFVDATSSEA